MSRRLVLAIVVCIGVMAAPALSLATPGQGKGQGPPSATPGNSGQNPHGGPPGLTGSAPGGKPTSSPGKPTSSPGNSGSNPHGGPPGLTGSAPPSSSAGSGDEGDTSTDEGNSSTDTGDENGTSNPGDEGNGGGNGDVNGNAGGNGHAGKVTICHATGSATNPFVGITISVNGLNGHAGHQDGRDIIPATGDCPAGETPSGGNEGSNGGNGPGGKVSLCHATGSETNPFVFITISVNGLNGHAGHQDGEDIIPASSSADCPAGESPPAGGGPTESNGNGGQEHPGRVTICHATGSETNPFVVITISVNGLNGHAGHQDGEDVIPAPESGDCAAQPTLAVSPVTGGAGPGSGVSPLEVAAVIPLAEESPGHGVLGEHGSGGSNSPKPSSGVEAVNSSGTSPSADTGDTPASPTASGTGDTEKHGLPFTGLDVLGLLAVGAVAIGLGLLLRRLARRPA